MREPIFFTAVAAGPVTRTALGVASLAFLIKIGLPLLGVEHQRRIRRRGDDRLPDESMTVAWVVPHGLRTLNRQGPRCVRRRRPDHDGFGQRLVVQGRLHDHDRPHRSHLRSGPVGHDSRGYRRLRLHDQLSGARPVPRARCVRPDRRGTSRGFLERCRRSSRLRLGEHGGWRLCGSRLSSFCHSGRSHVASTLPQTVTAALPALAEWAHREAEARQEAQVHRARAVHRARRAGKERRARRVSREIKGWRERKAGPAPAAPRAHQDLGGIGGRGGTTGTGGAGGDLAGRGGTTGTAGTGGGLAGRGGTTGTAGTGGGLAGRGGTTGTAGSGGRGGAAGGTGGGTSAYNPCPTNGDPCKILPLGDIDHARLRVIGRWRLSLAVIQVDRRGGPEGDVHRLTRERTHAGVGADLPRNHEGHDGWTIDPGYSSYGAGGISSLIPSPALNANPHIILLHIGTNDTGAMDATNMFTRLEALLDKISQASATSLIVLAQIAPLGYNSAPLTAYNAKIPGIVQSHAAKGQHIVGVDMSKLPVPADIGSDNIHPNDQGYAYMANVWYAAIKDLLPK